MAFQPTDAMMRMMKATTAITTDRLYDGTSSVCIRVHGTPVWRWYVDSTICWYHCTVHTYSVIYAACLNLLRSVRQFKDEMSTNLQNSGNDTGALCGTDTISNSYIQYKIVCTGENRLRENSATNEMYTDSYPNLMHSRWDFLLLWVKWIYLYMCIMHITSEYTCMHAFYYECCKGIFFFMNMKRNVDMK